MRLKPSAYLILGVLRGGVDTGYTIKSAVDQRTRFFWATSFAQIYPELAELERWGYIVGKDDPHGSARGAPAASQTGAIMCSKTG